MCGCLEFLVELKRLQEDKTSKNSARVAVEPVDATWNTVDSAESELARRYECKLCMERPIQCVLLPCGHTLSCSVCGVKLAHCPLCEVIVTGRTVLHLMS